MKRYAIGIDFGTLSARAVVVRLSDGKALAASSMDYPHAVMNQSLPSGRVLERGWALQHPDDYLQALLHTVPEAVRAAGVPGEEIAAIGVDFTCTTSLPTLLDGTPLCTLPEFADEPNAYVKLWKHHAEKQAAYILQIARDMHLPWLDTNGGRVSSEWILPKLLQLKQEAPALYARTQVYLEAGDWIVWKLCGRLCRSLSFAAYKNFYLDGYPPDAFFRAIDPAFSRLPSTLLRGDVLPLTQQAGVLCKEFARALSLPEGIPVAPAITDAHAGVLSAGLCENGDLLAILGTSACFLLQEVCDKPVTGLAGKAFGGILPGLFSYEANQSMGENFAWYIQNACPASCAQEAQARGLSLHQLMNEKAAPLPPGGNGLIALDWFGGNRCILGDSELTGMILGLTTQTQPEAIYRALLESTAYAMRTIVDNFTRQGVGVRRIVAMGGIAGKSPLLMQILSDVLGREIAVSAATEGAAQGAAIQACGCCGAFADMFEAVKAMGQPTCAVYRPGENQPRYEALYRHYQTLHDFFGRERSDIMHALSRFTTD